MYSVCICAFAACIVFQFVCARVMLLPVCTCVLCLPVYAYLRACAYRDVRITQIMGYTSSRGISVSCSGTFYIHICEKWVDLPVAGFKEGKNAPPAATESVNSLQN